MKKGFTLIELLIILAIVGIVLAIAIPQFSHHRKVKELKEQGYTSEQIRYKLNPEAPKLPNYDAPQQGPQPAPNTGNYKFCPNCGKELK